MKTLFLLCTAVTILQVLDVSITGVSAAGTPDPLKAPKETSEPNAGKKKTTTRTVKKPNPTPNATKPEDDKASPDPVENDPGTNPNEDDSAEAEPPKTIKESGKRVVKTLKKMATNRGIGLLNGFTGFLKKTGGAFNFFGNFLRDRAKGVKDVAKDSLGVLSSVSDSTTRGTKHLLTSGRVIGTRAGKEMYSALQKATKLGTNSMKLGGTAMGTPLSIGEDVVGTTNLLAKVPSRLSKMVTEGAIKPVLSYLGPSSSEEQPEEQEGEEGEEEKEEEKKEDPPKAPPKAPVKTPQTPQKTMTKKPTSKSP